MFERTDEQRPHSLWFPIDPQAPDLLDQVVSVEVVHPLARAHPPQGVGLALRPQYDVLGVEVL
jgi:hypothetical protein